MKLATRKNGTRDGELLVVSRDHQRAALVGPLAPTMQSLMDDWSAKAPEVLAMAAALEAGTLPGAFDVDCATLHSPLPRAYAWIDGSAYINHIVLVRKARGAAPPETLRTDPLVYQGGSDTFLGPRDAIPLANPDWGCDFESEIAVVLDDTPQGVRAEDVGQYIRLVMLCNDVSLRNLIPGELAKGFGFFGSKPSSAFSPFAVTPDELGDAWRDGRLHLPLITHLNGEKYGDPNAGPEMFFSFHDIIAHLCRTRSLSAGTIVGSGTVSNEDRARGSSCLAEQRMLEKIDTGAFITPFMKHGDHVAIEMFNAAGDSLFGRIEQTVVPG
ncbi:MAG TPA: 2-keto-4-pentenoate hydratase [Deltaproteobacteria bacterium]|nr:2-keto-4-pentenoate hydratase [Deltaproteobacteria bacterium]